MLSQEQKIGTWPRGETCLDHSDMELEILTPPEVPSSSEVMFPPSHHPSLLSFSRVAPLRPCWKVAFFETMCVLIVLVGSGSGIFVGFDEDETGDGREL
jgi:hypothetical protein